MATTNAPELARYDLYAAIMPTLMEQVFRPLHAQVVQALTREADAQGKIDLAKLSALQRTVRRLVGITFLGKPGQDGTVEPYTEVKGKVIPQSAYFAALWLLMKQSASLAVEAHADLMRKYLPEDLLRLLSMATLDPFSRAVEEMDEPDASIFVPLQYDPMHKWIGPDGRQLSDRIWRLTGDMNNQLDQYLTAAIAQGKPVAQMARELDGFLVQPSLGGDFYSYNALRLARSEVASAGHRADYAAAQMNPLVVQYQPFVSPAHQETDECDVEVANGPYPKSDPAHLPIYHANCLCGIRWILAEVEQVVKSLREQVKDAIQRGTHAFTDWIGPLVKRFVQRLFGE